MSLKALLLIFGVLGVLFLAAACSGSSGPTPEAATPEAAEPAATSVPAESDGPSAEGLASDVETMEGGRLVRLFVDPPTLDPHLTTDATSAQIIVEVFGGLVTIDRDLNVILDLAESLDVSDDGRVYTFRIRPDATFHDGRQVTAEDVRWSLERATNPLTESPVVDQYLGDIVGVNEKLNGDAQTITGVRVVDERTIEITIDQAKSYFLAKLTYPTAFVVDRENIEASPKNWFRRPNGTGPFQLAEYEVGETILLTRNDGYHLGPALGRSRADPERRHVPADVRERRDPSRRSGLGRFGQHSRP
jgi:ABC-type transport system substrate-binding protein